MKKKKKKAKAKSRRITSGIEWTVNSPEFRELLLKFRFAPMDEPSKIDEAFYDIQAFIISACRKV